MSFSSSVSSTSCSKHTIIHCQNIIIHHIFRQHNIGNPATEKIHWINLHVIHAGRRILHLLVLSPSFLYQGLQVVRRLLCRICLISIRYPPLCLGHDKHLDLLPELNMEDSKLLGKPLSSSSLAWPSGAKQKHPHSRRLVEERKRNLLEMYFFFLWLFPSHVSLYLERPSLCNKLHRVLEEGVPGFLAWEAEDLLTVLGCNFILTRPQDVVVF